MMDVVVVVVVGTVHFLYKYNIIGWDDMMMDVNGMEKREAYYNKYDIIIISFLLYIYIYDIRLKYTHI